jgi:hypothetical protein
VSITVPRLACAALAVVALAAGEAQAAPMAAAPADHGADPVRTWSHTFRLRPQRTRTYQLHLPAGFTVSATPDPVGYTLYPRTGPGFAVSHAIEGRHGRRPAYLGATVLRTDFDGRVVTVKVRTAKLARPLALQIGARGTA